MKKIKSGWKITEFSYGFCVSYNDKRVALTETEDEAEDRVNELKGKK